VTVCFIIVFFYKTRRKFDKRFAIDKSKEEMIKHDPEKHNFRKFINQVIEEVINFLKFSHKKIELNRS
jgi:hypothetical protein